MTDDHIRPADPMLEELRRTRLTAVVAPLGCLVAILGVLIGVVRIAQTEAGTHPHVFEGGVVCLFSVLLGIVIAMCRAIAVAVQGDPSHGPR